MFSLDAYSTKAQVLAAIKALGFLGGELANVGLALEFVVEKHFTRAGGSRVDEGVPQVLVLVSAGPSSDEIHDGVVALKQASVFSFCLGAQAAPRAELQDIATSDHLVFTVPDFRSFGDVQEQLLSYVVGVAQRHIVLQPPTIVTQGTYALLALRVGRALVRRRRWGRGGRPPARRAPGEPVSTTVQSSGAS